MSADSATPKLWIFGHCVLIFFDDLQKFRQTCFHLTLSFPYSTSEVRTRHLLNTFLKHLNRRIFKHQYDEGYKYIDGFVIREYTYGMETDHFHILMAEINRLPDYDRMKQLIQQQVDYLKPTKTDLWSKKNYIKDFLLQDYINDGTNALENYLTKQFDWKSSSLEQVVDSIGTLGPDDVAFGCVSFRK